jgi:short-subunit dehydrogenase
MKPFSFSGKNILVTGASGGLGSSLVKDLAEAGSHLVISSRSYGTLTQLISTLPAETRISAVSTDLSVPGNAEVLVRKAIASLGHIDVLFNNAGIGYFALMEEATDENIRYLFEVNTFAPLALIRALLPHMKHRKKGRIINIVSCAGRVPVPSEGVYGGSKTALAVMTNTMRLELEPAGIKIINIYPGTTDTSFEENALREKERPGLHPTDNFGVSSLIISKTIITAAAGPSGEVWLDKGSKWLATIALDWPKFADSRLMPLRDRVLDHTSQLKQLAHRRWRSFRLQSSNAYHSNCMSRFGKDLHRQTKNIKRMPQRVWEAIRPYLPEVQTVIFSHGGEHLPPHRLTDWIKEAKAAGCETEFEADAVHVTMPFAHHIIESGIDRIAVTMIGATADIYASVTAGIDFEALCENIQQMTSGRTEHTPELTVNFILAPLNIHQTQDMIKLAAHFGVEKVKFKQCNIIQGFYGKGSGFLYSKENREKRRITSVLSKARRLSQKRKIDFRSFSHPPDEEPVCDQDPRYSFFIRHDGAVAPCVNLASGGTLLFMDRQVKMPAVHYGQLPGQKLMDLWEGKTCGFFRKRFNDRVHAYDSTLGRSSFEASWPELQKVLQAARDAMPKPPEGCSHCPALYDM